MLELGVNVLKSLQCVGLIVDLENLLMVRGISH